MKIGEWIGAAVGAATLISMAGAVVVYAGDTRWVTQESMIQKEIRDLNKEITYIEIKEAEGEASKTERIYVETLKQQKEDLEAQLR